MNFEVDEFFAELAATIRAKKPFPSAMRTMIDWCSRHLPHDDWEKIETIDYSADEQSAQGWIPSVLKESPVPFEIHGLYFGLAEVMNDNDEEFADLYVAFMGQYEASDKEARWVFGEKRHYPQDASLKVKSLMTAGTIFNRESGDGLGNNGNFVFCLSYTLLLATSLMTSQLHEQLGTSAANVGILAGWDSGDLMRPGELTSSGFKPNLERMT